MRTTKPLTPTQVKNARPRKKEYNLADGGGLFLRVKPNGTRLWLFNYFKPFTRNRSNLSLGLYPALSLKDARETAAAYRALLAKDIDPKEERERTARETTEAHLNTFRTVAGKWLAVKAGKASPAYLAKIEQGLKNHVYPKMGKLPIHKLTAPNTIAALEPLAGREAMETVSKLCRWINEIMTYAVNTGIIHHNPLAGIREGFRKVKTQNMPTIRPDELPDFMKALNKSTATVATKSLIEWQLHTMVRPGEAAGTRWEEIDLDNKVWTIPEGRMKTGRAHAVPLSDRAITILETMRPISGHREYVFPSSTAPRKPASSQSANMAIKRMGYKGKLVSHGLRALASTTLNEQQFDRDVIEVALAHVDKNTIRSAYNRAQYLEQRRTMLQWWSDFIEQATGGSATQTGTKHLRLTG